MRHAVAGAGTWTSICSNDGSVETPPNHHQTASPMIQIIFCLRIHSDTALPNLKQYSIWASTQYFGNYHMCANTSLKRSC